MKYSSISDDSLVQVLKAYVVGNPNIGYKAAKAHLHSRGINVQYERVRLAMLRIDPGGVALRWSNVVKRRTYHVSTPNALWHIDGHHKLIR